MEDENEKILEENNIMQNDIIINNKDIYFDSNCFSRFFFGWAFNILYSAKKNKLSSKLSYKLNDSIDSSFYFNNLEEIWETKNYKNYKKHALIRTILKSNICKIILVLILSLISFISEYISVILLNFFIKYLDPSSQKPTIFSYAPSLLELGIIYIIMNIINIFSTVHLYMRQGVFAIKAGFELASFVYNKLKNVSNSSFIKMAKHGEIINFIQIDANKLTWLITESPNFFICPIKIVAYVYLLWEFFGYSFFAAIFVLIVFFIINYFIFKQYRNAQKDFLSAKDERIQITKETFENMKYLKAYNWEFEFERKISEKRNNELKKLKKRLYITVLNTSLFWLASSLISIFTIGLYQYLNDKINTSALLMGITLFGKIKSPLFQLPQAINTLLEVFVSMKRVEEFLNQPNINRNIYLQNKFNENYNYSIKIKDGDFTWGKKSIEQDEKFISDSKSKIRIETISEITPSETENFLINDNNNINNENQILIPNDCIYNIDLKKINLDIKIGELVAIIGEIGSGKTTLLETILNSLILLNPNECDGIYINGSISYVPQIPWIQNETIKNNIILFNKFDQVKYNEVLNFSELIYDLKNLEGGDQTEIGERGINLSGGQKSRLTLARALYQNSDIYLFDDILSALDAQVGKKIMNNCLLNYLKNKTRILVTHSINFLHLMDRIIYMQEGKIIFNGTFDQIQKQDFYHDLKNLINYKEENKDNINIELDNINTKENNIISLSDFKIKNNEIKKLTLEEDEEIGSVKLNVYNTYAKYMGGKFFLFCVFLVMCIWQGAKSGSSLWVSYWSKDENKDKDTKTRWWFFGIYSLLDGGSVIFIFLKTLLLVIGMLKLQKNLHIDMIEKLIKSPINLFYDIVPEGQILNRLTKDIDIIIYTIFDIGYLLLDLVSSLGALILCCIYDLNSIVIIPIFSLLGIFISRFYLRGSRALSRMEAISRSPILNIVSETITGASSIRAYDLFDNYLKKYYSKINDCLKYNICLKGISNWLQLTFNLISLLYIIYLIIRVVIYQEEISSQEVSIIFHYSVLFQSNLGWMFTNYCYLENLMVSMERCIKYTKLKSENYFIENKTNDQIIEKNWPKQGKIEFINYSVKYRPDTEKVIKNFNLIINHGEKIGVIGRTGSGKSTLCLCLFRILESFEGKILMDDMDISQIELNLLRKKITFIPQESCLFAGNLRYNLDPLNIYSDNEINNVVKKIGLEFNDEINILDKKIEENGINLSLGERQLICIGRAFLKKSKIIIMDEATAYVDYQTEEKIQKILEELLNNCTVITIAHRIKSILNYDKILVLEKGKIVEYDTPKNLIGNNSSIFFREFYSKINSK